MAEVKNCQCLKTDDKKCTCEASKKPNMNTMYCCQKPYESKSITVPIPTPILIPVVPQSAPTLATASQTISSVTDLLHKYPQLDILVTDMPKIDSPEFNSMYEESMEEALNFLLKTDAVGDSGYIELFGHNDEGPLGINWLQYGKLHPKATVWSAIVEFRDQIAQDLGFD